MAYVKTKSRIVRLRFFQESMAPFCSLLFFLAIIIIMYRNFLSNTSFLTCWDIGSFGNYIEREQELMFVT